VALRNRELHARNDDEQNGNRIASLFIVGTLNSKTVSTMVSINPVAVATLCEMLSLSCWMLIFSRCNIGLCHVTGDSAASLAKLPADVHACNVDNRAVWCHHSSAPVKAETFVSGPQCRLAAMHQTYCQVFLLLSSW